MPRIVNQRKEPEVPAAAVLSFLRDTRSLPTWAESELAKSLNLSREQTKQVLAALQLQGYAESTGRAGNWRTTEQGELVSGGKAPRFTRESIENALAEMSKRIKSFNEDASASYQVNAAVAFGDFLTDRARVQAAEVGIELQRRSPEQGSNQTAAEHARENAFLRQLRGKSTMLHIQKYAPWMNHRSHRKLL
jgi:predicted ArsR family transcriptional regulator